MSGDNNKLNSEDPALTPSAPSAYFVLTLLFLSLWLITTAVGGVWLGCRTAKGISLVLPVLHWPRGMHQYQMKILVNVRHPC